MAEKENKNKLLSKQLKEYFENDPSVFSNSSKTYLKDYRQNTFAGIESRYEQMFNNGQGGELEGKAKAIHSSSMLAFNFFSWITGKDEKSVLILGDVRYSKAYFEVQLPTLVGSNYYANMDVVLEGYDSKGQKTLLFIESKFTEHEGTGSSGMTKMQNNSYSHDGEGRYFKYFSANKPYVKEYWHKLIKSFDPSCNVGYLDGIKQEICHIIALSNLKNDNQALNKYKCRYADEKRKRIEHPEINGDEIFLFYNVLYNWEGSNSFERYKELYCRFEKEVQSIPSCASIKLDILSYHDIYNLLPDGALKQYLFERYIKFCK